MFKISLVYSKAQKLLYVILSKLVQFRQVAPSKFSRCATLKSKLERGLFSLGVRPGGLLITRVETWGGDTYLMLSKW